ncbi:MAG: copper homeostasis protein CutC [Anaerococcus sp.]|nr:copper homeostasis protein CutC [Peptoniphilaceae bacterium]MDY3055165.1 copper homeostasis protein CutC [Anaerococcus sp.]
MKLEICIDSYQSFLNAEKAGADRVEVCSSLALDGLTPSVGLVSLIENSKLEKFIMIRPREGDFSYSDKEFLQMKKEIEIFKNYKIDGFVFGILDKEDNLDFKRMKELIDLARPFSCVLHRAVDYSKDFEASMDRIIDLGFIRILTSGQKEKAIEGLDLIKKLQENYRKRIEIMAGSGVNFENIKEIYEKTKIENFHTSARLKEKSDDRYMDYYRSDYDLIKKAKLAVENLG